MAKEDAEDEKAGTECAKETTDAKRVNCMNTYSSGKATKKKAA